MLAPFVAQFNVLTCIASSWLSRRRGRRNAGTIIAFPDNGARVLPPATGRIWYAEALVESCVLHPRRVRLFWGDPLTRIPHPTTADMSACINSTQRIYERAFKTPYPSERETSSTPTTPTVQHSNRKNRSQRRLVADTSVFT